MRSSKKYLAKITVSVIYAGIKVTEDLKKTSALISEKIIEEVKPAPIKKDSKVDKKKL